MATNCFCGDFREAAKNLFSMAVRFRGGGVKGFPLRKRTIWGTFFIFEVTWPLAQGTRGGGIRP